MTERQKIAADYVINFYKEKEGVPLHNSSIFNYVDQTKHSLADIRYILHFLTLKGFLAASDGVNKEVLYLTDKGWLYETYDRVLLDEKRKVDLEEALITSSIASNKSVKYVNRLFWLTAIFSFISAIGTLGSFILQVFEKSQKTSQEILRSQKDTIEQSKPILSVADSLIKK